jgi:hypothetical protein
MQAVTAIAHMLPPRASMVQAFSIQVDLRRNWWAGKATEAAVVVVPRVYARFLCPASLIDLPGVSSLVTPRPRVLCSDYGPATVSGWDSVFFALRLSVTVSATV